MECRAGAAGPGSREGGVMERYPDFRDSDEFLVLRSAVRGLGSDDSDEGSAIERSIRRLAVAYGVNAEEVFAAVNEEA